MQNYTIKNKHLTAEISNHGAELRSLKDNASGHEFMWQADAAYWGRTSPVLFPVVGNYRDKTSIYNGRKFTLGQHGFARDMDFELASSAEDSISFLLRDNNESAEKYPFKFELLILYELDGHSLNVKWKVKNTGDKTMYFSIGGHPAFNCSLEDDSLIFDRSDFLEAEYLNEKGCVSKRKEKIYLDGHGLKLSNELFKDDALILEGNQIHSVTLRDKNSSDVLSVTFDAPVAGLWSPAKKNAPFVCIEPWYGRSDREDFNQDLTQREWGNKLECGGEFFAEYKITAGNADSKS